MLFVLFMILFIVAADQAVKYWAVHFLAGSDFRPEIPGLIGLTYVENRGAAFGILENMRWLFLILTPVVVGVILVVLFKKRVHGRLGVCSLAMITGGAIGNFIDRAVSGYVVDLFEFKFIRFAVFNLADAFITVGAVLLCIYMLFVHDKAAAKTKAGGQYDGNAAL